MKTIVNYTLLISLALSLSSCQLFVSCEEGQGNLVKKEISLANFDEISIEGNYHVYLSQADTQKVYIKAHENLISLLNTEVKGSQWKIDFDPCVKSIEAIEFYVSVKSLKEINVEGSGKVIGENTLKSNQLVLNIDGSGDIQLDIDVKELESEINGSGDIQLSGKTKKHEIEVNGSGDIDAYELMSDNCEIEINGSGDVKVHVSYDLNAEVNGSGDIYYKGSVKNINSSINGSGNLNQAQ